MDHNSPDPNEPDLNGSALGEEYMNAKDRLNQQRNILTAFAKEARQTFRIILVLASLLISSITVLSPRFELSQGCSVYVVPNWCLSLIELLTVSGIALVVGAICNGMIGTEARAIGSVGTSKDIEEVLEGKSSEEDYLRERLRRYQKRIERNNGVIESLETVLAIGKLCIFVGILGLATAGINVIVGPIEWNLTILVLCVVCFSILVLGRTMPDEYIRQDSMIDGEGYISELFLTEDRSKDEK